MLMRFVIAKRLPEANELRSISSYSQKANYEEKKRWSETVQKEFMFQHPEWKEISSSLKYPVFIQVTEVLSSRRFRGYDADNLTTVAGKLIVDALTDRTVGKRGRSGLGFFRDDAPDYIQWLPTKHMYVATGDCYTVITVCDGEDVLPTFVHLKDGVNELGWSWEYVTMLALQKYGVKYLQPDAPLAN